MKRILILLVMVPLLLSGCKPKVPRQYIQQGKMRRILYDYALASEMARRSSSDSLLMLSYKTAIMQKHGVTVEEFDSSMVYYTRHTRLLYDIYDKISKQLEEEALAQGASMSDLSKYGQLASASDTASVWSGERSFILSPYATMNQKSFVLKADTSFHKGDKIVLDFDVQYISPTNMHNAVALLTVKFNGDSTATYNRSISTSSHLSITVDDKRRVGINEIRCSFVIGQLENSNKTQLLCFRNLKMVRMHTSEPKDAPVTGPIRTDTLRRDSAHRPTMSEHPVVPVPQDEAPKAMPRREILQRQMSAPPPTARKVKQ